MKPTVFEPDLWGKKGEVGKHITIFAKIIVFKRKHPPHRPPELWPALQASKPKTITSSLEDLFALELPQQAIAIIPTQRRDIWRVLFLGEHREKAQKKPPPEWPGGGPYLAAFHEPQLNAEIFQRLLFFCCSFASTSLFTG